MTESPPALPTVGVIAKRHDAEIHQVEYVIRTRRLQPVGRAGSAFIYSDNDVDFIGHELRRIARDKEQGRC